MKLNGLRKHSRQQEAKERNEAWASMTPQQQLHSLDGRGMAATRQRARIQAQIDKAKEQK